MKKDKIALPKKQRLSIYNETLILIKERIKNKDSAFICERLIELLIKNGRYNVTLVTTHRYLPELIQYKPKGCSNFEGWWSETRYGNKRRVEVLEDIIGKLKAELTTKK